MRQSELFSKTLKTFPKDEESVNAKFLIRAGFIKKASAGIYSYLPLGWRVLSKINNIVREEMNAISGQELLMPVLVAREYWEKTNRWNVEAMYKLKSIYGEEYGLGWTHEEVVVDLARHLINSYQDLPLALYQIQIKFRSEARPKSGLLRGREFWMKDLYSFHTDKEDLEKYYKTVIGVYNKILKRLGLEAKLTEASGGAFTKEYTHEFQVLAESGEDTVFYCAKCDFCQNKEIAKVRVGSPCPKCGGEIQESRAIEVANIFRLGTKYTKPYGVYFTDKNGSRKLAIMGCYGIGPSRLMGTLVEIYHDNNGIVWPDSVSPYKLHLLAIGKEVDKKAEKFYNQLNKAGIEVLYDDRKDVSAGAKFVDADLIGISYRGIISEKTGDKIELKCRSEKKTKLVNLKEIKKLLAKY
jgi:prolyl-tRNA synthetase